MIIEKIADMKLSTKKLGGMAEPENHSFKKYTKVRSKIICICRRWQNSFEMNFNNWAALECLSTITY